MEFNSRIKKSVFIFLFLALLVIASGCVSDTRLNEASKTPALIPIPLSVSFGEKYFTLSNDSKILAPADAEKTGKYLSETLSRSTGYPFDVTGDEGENRDISLNLDPSLSALGEEGYRLNVSETGIAVSASGVAGLFYGCQTLLQLLPPSIFDFQSVQGVAWQVVYCTIEDVPRFSWRGAMLDVARHFLGVDDVKHYIDLIAMHKMNRLHLHLSDDQGWRIEIKSWPDLTAVGGSTEVGGRESSFFTQEDYREIVDYAVNRHIMIIPEIDVPGHTNAALASYPKLNCNGKARALYTGIEVGLSCLCLDADITYTFLEDVFGELAALTPGPYIHLGGDEVRGVSYAKYSAFIEKVEKIIHDAGKQVIGWEEIVRADLAPATLVQFWHSMDLAGRAKNKNLKIIVSKASLAYLDMKYDYGTWIGQTWAGMINVEKAYKWDPAMGKLADNVAGLEAPLWTEYVQSRADMEYLAFPRLAGYAELAWSSREKIDWDNYKARLRRHGLRFDVLKINYYKSPLIWGDE
ncbi:MAG: beta-N-acetylhexosaminidase [Spirochaetales bacterium]|nr:beta-N-acetylhexosaminidase [Spirochaetales bacterium]